MIPEGDWPPPDSEYARLLLRESFRRSMPPVQDENGRRWYPDSVPLAWVIGALDKTPVGPGLSALAVVAEQLDIPSIEDGSLLTKKEKKWPPNSSRCFLVRFPGIMSLVDAPLQAVGQNDELIATLSPGFRRYQADIPLQRTLPFPGPLTLDGIPTAGTWIEALAEVDLVGDLRSPLRGDIFRLGLIAFALTRPVTIPEETGAILVGGRDTSTNRRRFWDAHQAMRCLHVRVGGSGGRFDLFVAEAAGDVAKVGPAHWWVSKAGPMHYKLSAGLFRLPGAGGAEKWKGGLYRTLNGIEAALLYGPPPGRKRGGRVSHFFQALNSGGPGPSVFLQHWQVLRFAGENVTQDSYRGSSPERHRYRTRVEGLRKAGYFCSDGELAPAGDTIEILRQVMGGKNHPGGLVVRASARGCALQDTGKSVEDFRLSGLNLIERLKTP